MSTCGRCSATVAPADAECCWFCTGDLCVTCWERRGHCGHPEANAINAAARVATPDQRRALALAAFGGEDLGPPRPKARPS